MRRIKISSICVIVFILFISVKLFPNDILTKEERDYLAKHGEISFVGDTKYPPFYFQKSDSEIAGITPDFLRWLSVEFDLNIVLHHRDLYEGMQSVLDGKNDVMCDLFYNKSRDSLFDFTEPLYQIESYIYIPVERTDIHSLNDLSGEIVAIQKGDYAIDYLHQKGIMCKIIETPDFESAIEELIKGKADAVVGDDPVIMYYAYKLKIRDMIKRTGGLLYTANSCLAVRNGDTELLNILNKCVKFAEKKNIINKLTIKWLGVPLNAYKEPLMKKFVPWVIIIVLALIFITFTIWLWNFRLQKLLNKKTRELKLSLDKLHDYKERMENVLKTVRGYVYWGKISENRQIADWDSSDSIVEITGYEKEYFRKQEEKFWKRLIYPDDWKRVDDAFYGLRENGKEINLEYRIKTKEGEVRWLSENAKVVRDKNTGEETVRGICLDITETRKLRNLLNYQRAYFKSLFDNLNEAAVITDKDGNFIEINKYFTDLFGYKKEEIKGKNYIDLMTNEKKTDYLDYIRKKISENKTITFDTKRRSKDGKLIDVLVMVSPIIIESRLEGAIIILIDIRERKRLTDQIRDERERLHTTLKSIGEAVFVTDVEGKIEMINRIAEIKFGFTDKEVKGKFFLEILEIPDEEEKQGLINSFQKAIKNREVITLKNGIHIIGKDNAEFVLSISISPIFTGNSEVRGVVLVFNDITYIQKMENALVRAKNLESLGVLAGGIAHDFNNYLTAILGNIEIAEMKGKWNDEMKQLLDKMKNATIDAKNLTTQLLTFAKGDNNLKKLTSVSDLIRDTVNFVLSGSNARGKLDIDENLWNAVIDKSQIKNVISNLLINAEQSMEEGGNITIKANNIIITGNEGLQLTPGKYIKIEVIDEGKGIPPEIIDNIFDPYFTTKRMGSGLGLATAHSIVRNHNGLITVESKMGKGSKFTVYLPASIENISKEEISAGRKNIKTRARILVMDDEEMIRDVVGEMLNIMGYEAEFAKDGVEAIKKYNDAMEENRKFDIVLLDLTIPGGMGGRETMEKLLKLDPDVKGIIVSGYSTDVIISEYEKYGFKEAVLKPFRMDELSSVLKKILNGD